MERQFLFSLFLCVFQPILAWKEAIMVFFNFLNIKALNIISLLQDGQSVFYYLITKIQIELGWCSNLDFQPSLGDSVEVEGEPALGLTRSDVPQRYSDCTEVKCCFPMVLAPPRYMICRFQWAKYSHITWIGVCGTCVMWFGKDSVILIAKFHKLKHECQYIANQNSWFAIDAISDYRLNTCCTQ